jgi:hypothetical protein
MTGGMSRGRCVNAPYERRSDRIAAMVVDVAVIYANVFGRNACLSYFAMAGIEEAICKRIFARHCRRRPL